jgi:hypothetical protein
MNWDKIRDDFWGGIEDALALGVEISVAQNFK